MLYLSMQRAEIGQAHLAKLAALKKRLAERFKPLLHPIFEAAGKVLNVEPETLRRSRAPRRVALEGRRVALDGEVYADGKNLIIFSVYPESQRQPGRARRVPLTAVESAEPAYRLSVCSIGPESKPESLVVAVDLAREVLGVELSPFVFKSERFNVLKAEGREPPAEPLPEEQRGAQELRDRTVRGLALAIKSSGGLLVRDLSKQLPIDDRPRTEGLTAALRTAGLIESEVVVVCGKTQAQVTRAPSRDVLADLSSKGLKCACGRPLAEERIEEALAITDLGRSLLDKARWLTILLIQELREVGIGRDAILLEQTVGGDELDCLANISGELALFELKDKEFSLGNAYSFGAKIGITRPDHPVIITTERVGNDAREHFVRARLAGSQREEPDIEFPDDFYVTFAGEGGPREVTYIEGVHNLRPALQQLVSAIYRKDASTILDEVVPLAALEGRALVRALEDPSEEGKGVQQRDAANDVTA